MPALSPFDMIAVLVPYHFFFFFFFCNQQSWFAAFALLLVLLLPPSSQNSHWAERNFAASSPPTYTTPVRPSVNKSTSRVDLSQTFANVRKVELKVTVKVDLFGGTERVLDKATKFSGGAFAN